MDIFYLKDDFDTPNETVERLIGRQEYFHDGWREITDIKRMDTHFVGHEFARIWWEMQTVPVRA